MPQKWPFRAEKLQCKNHSPWVMAAEVKVIVHFGRWGFRLHVPWVCTLDPNLLVVVSGLCKPQVKII